MCLFHITPVKSLVNIKLFVFTPVWLSRIPILNDLQQYFLVTIGPFAVITVRHQNKYHAYAKTYSTINSLFLLQFIGVGADYERKRPLSTS